ncbi:MAG: hypothetical protein Q8912_01935 [Bacillota bacterium]|nr:hypothetical protein [Bacillota bacterium]
MKFVKILVSIIVVFSLLGCSTTKSQSTTSTNTKPASQPQSTTPQVQAASTNPTQMTNVSFQWIGVDADKLSPNDIKPDGKLDGHFHITIPFSQPYLVKSIWIRYTQFGKSYKWGWIYNKNLPIAGYKMAVFDDQGQPILPQGDNGYRVNALIDLDLYISELNFENERDTLKLEENQLFNLEVDYITQSNDEKEFNGSVTTT